MWVSIFSSQPSSAVYRAARSGTIFRQRKDGEHTHLHSYITQLLNSTQNAEVATRSVRAVRVGDGGMSLRRCNGPAL
jgi:hypothetical protein